MKNRLLMILSLLLLASCGKEPGMSVQTMTQDQRDLIGRAVNFDTSESEEYQTKADYYSTTGGFNEGDFLTVYRQYWVEPDGTTPGHFGELSYRVYYRHHEYAPGTNTIVGKPTWKPRVGKKGYNEVFDALHPEEHLFTQAESDSLTWDNGRTVRYRAVGRSNFYNSINGSKSSYYPDYTYSEWVTASGPTNDVAFVMKHLTSRIMFEPRPGNRIYRIEISTDPADYMREDNSDINDHDTSDKAEEAVATERAANVAAIYNKMCLPAGVDWQTGHLRGMYKSYYDAAANFYDIDERNATDAVVDVFEYGTLASDVISGQAQRPIFSRIDTRFLFMTAPYDMSNAETKGDILTLPDYTRFRIYLYDINSGDEDETDPDKKDFEKSYHIFALSDIAEFRGRGLDFSAGNSYTFRVGYKYDTFSVSLVNEMSWTPGDTVDGTAADDPAVTPSTTPFAWWTGAFASATATVAPSFTISNSAELMELETLVSGAAVTADAGAGNLKQEYRQIKRADGSVDEVNSGYWWYTGDLDDSVQWYGKAGTMVSEGPFRNSSIPDAFSDFIFYWNGTGWDYLKSAFDFYDNSNHRPYVIELGADIDMHDMRMDAIGSEAAPFRGDFNGRGHLLSNLDIAGGYLFGYISKSSIRNLRMSSTNRTGLVNKGVGECHLIGISVEADCTGSSIASSLIGTVGSEVFTSYVVGCIHTGSAGAAMIGQADDLVMYGCMEAGTGINRTGTGGVLLGAYASTATEHFFDPQQTEFAQWGIFMCNYFDRFHSGEYAVPGNKTLDYHAQEYIRGLRDSELKALNNYLIRDEVEFDKLSANQKLGLYGLAPWRAMDYAIWYYNTRMSAGSLYPCDMRYSVNQTGYDNRYPVLSSHDWSQDSFNYGGWNVLNQNN